MSLKLAQQLLYSSYLHSFAEIVLKTGLVRINWRGLFHFKADPSLAR